MPYEIYFVIALAIFLLYLIAVRPMLQRRAEFRAKQDEAERRRQAAEALIRQQEEKSRKLSEEIQREAEEREQTIQRAIAAVPGSEQYRVPQETEAHMDDLNITEFTPVSKSRYVAFDLETTGLDSISCAIIEIGAVRVENGIITDEFSQLIDPGYSIPYAASAVNHITDEMVSGQPRIYEVLPAFLSFVGDDVLVAHNAPFDMRFLAQACMRNRFRVPSTYFDTMTLSRYWPESNSKKLTALAACAGIEPEDAHRALSDARTVAQLVAATNARRAENKKSKKK